ncbi:hypothetical protein BDV26DRAFT_251041 [Aspergillus bertholletiae]|uniref:RING-type domain-containing protein n=1 Tax=Aspergillus bertholletiae TaxID=1226010 RepID=A0A5N7BQ00_9EURO|nr:hypothetical protein BDV26DRAFT_251041 [Aspergillus bertholletiae]
MSGYYLHVPHPTERGRLTVRDLLLSQMPFAFGQSKWSDKIFPDTCVFCLETLGPSSPYRLLPCDHVFHLPCIDRWLCGEDASCPICRQQFYHLRGPRMVYIAHPSGNSSHHHELADIRDKFHTLGVWFGTITRP